MMIETTKAFLTIFGALLIFLAAFSFSADDVKRKLVRVVLLFVFAAAIGNMFSAAAYGYRPVKWPVMMLLIAIAIAGWLSISHYLLRRKSVGHSRPVAV